MKTTELVYLIENAEQGSTLQEVESGAVAREELNDLLREIARLKAELKNAGGA